MKKEKWLKWEPLDRISPTFRLIDFKSDDGILTLSLQDRNNNSAPILDIHFDGFFALRIIHRGDKLKDSYDLDEAVMMMKPEPEYEYKWSLFMVENSHYVEWFQDQSVGIHEGTDIAHYLIRTPNEIFEVLDLNDPRPTLIWN